MNADQFNNPYAPTLGVEVRPERSSRHIAWFVSAAVVGFNLAVAFHDGVSVFAMNMFAEPMIWVANAGAASVALIVAFLGYNRSHMCLGLGTERIFRVFGGFLLGFLPALAVWLIERWNVYFKFAEISLYGTLSIILGASLVAVILEVGCRHVYACVFRSVISCDEPSDTPKSPVGCEFES